MPSKSKSNRIPLTKITDKNDNNAIHAALVTKTTTDVLCHGEAIDSVIPLKETSISIIDITTSSESNATTLLVSGATTASSTSELNHTNCAEREELVASVSKRPRRTDNKVSEATTLVPEADISNGDRLKKQGATTKKSKRFYKVSIILSKVSTIDIYVLYLHIF